MYQREVLGLSEARAAVEAALSEAYKQPERPMAVAVVDDRGDLVYCARMDGAYPLYMHMAINKAYTAARMLRDTAAFAERERELGRELTQLAIVLPVCRFLHFIATIGLGESSEAKWQD